MRKFEFRLQKVLDYREMVEEWAKEAYLEKQVERRRAEDDLADIETHRLQLCKTDLRTLDDRIALQRVFDKLDDDERHGRTVLQVLEAEEEALRNEWIAKKQEAEALRKLREKAVQDWIVEANREEQRDLDEWSSMRRTDERSA
jgi:flagellar FliJ protein